MAEDPQIFYVVPIVVVLFNGGMEMMQNEALVVDHPCLQVVDPCAFP